MMERGTDTPCGDLHELFLTNPLFENFAEVWRDALAAAGDIVIVFLEDRHPMSGSTQHVRDSETADAWIEKRLSL